MTEEAMFPFRVIFSLLRIGALMVVIIVFVWLFVNTLIYIHSKEIERAAVEIGESFVNTPIIYSTGVLDKTELDKYHGTNEEPYIRHCKFGYRVEVWGLEETSCSSKDDCKDFCMDTCNIDEGSIRYTSNQGDLIEGQGNCGCIVRECKCIKDGKVLSQYEWEFGYSKPADSEAEIIGLKDDTASVENPVSVYDPETGELIPARMKITAYDTWLTRASCLVEKAFESGNAHHMEIPCIDSIALQNMGVGGIPPMPIYVEICAFKLRKSGDDICLFEEKDGVIEDKECRYIGDVNFETFDSLYHTGLGKMANLTATPVLGGEGKVVSVELYVKYSPVVSTV